MLIQSPKLLQKPSHPRARSRPKVPMNCLNSLKLVVDSMTTKMMRLVEAVAEA